MRLTGQATTAIGNVITNLLVHAEFVTLNKSNIKLMFALGDDMIIMAKADLMLARLRKKTETHFNMQSKHKLNQTYGTFCQMLVHHNSLGTC